MEICIPTDRVPADILSRLREIGLTLQTDSNSPDRARIVPVTTQTVENKDKKTDERTRTVTFTSSVDEKQKNVDETDSCVLTDKDSDVVHVTDIAARTGEKGVMVQDRNDVVHVIGASSASPEKNTPSQFQYSAYQQFLSPQIHRPTFAKHHSEPDFRDRRTPSPNVHRYSPFKPLSSVEGQSADEECRLLHSRSPRRNEELPFQSNSNIFQQISRSQTSSTFSQNMPTKSTTQEEATSYYEDDDVVRVFPTPPLSAPPDIGCRSPNPKLLTPPETPECEGKRKVKDVFTFDDLACSQERMRQTFERMHQLQDQSTSRRDVMKTPTPRRPSTPTTPSYRRQDVPSSPRVIPTPQRFSPVDYPLRSRTESPSPQSKKKSCPENQDTSAQATPQRQAEEEFYAQRRDSLSPQPRKKLNFDDDGRPSTSQSPPMHQQSSQRARGFDFTGASYSALSSRHALDNAFPVSGFPGDHGESTASLYFPGGRGFGGCDTVEGLSRMAVQSARFAAKRKREMFHEDSGSDDIALCTCAVMERNFLQMAECAYKRIRRMDSSPADFERFRNELAQTNDILRESMGLMKHIREICDHRKRPRW